MKWICLCIKYQGSDPHRGGVGLAKVSADIFKKVNVKRKIMNNTKKRKILEKKNLLKQKKKENSSRFYDILIMICSF